MGTARPRSYACTVVAIALVAVLLPAGSAIAKGKHHRTFAFGSRVLEPGTKGKDIRYLQRALTRLGIATAIDGAFGKGTMRSVETLEQQHGWPVNGVVSRKDAKRIRKLVAKHRASGSYFVQGYTSPTLSVRARHAGNAKVKVLDAAGNVVQVIPVSFAGAESREVAWNGMTPAGFAGDALYRLKLGKSNTAGATASGQTDPFALHLHTFPVPGPHSFGGPDARFGAPRPGHTHQGQDIPATCGQSEIVDETGQVKVNAYQASGAGYYVVLHGGLTGTDSVYMHLRTPSWAPAGTTVYAGQQIGRVGDTGDAQGCHLHFERWSAPGWYSGGAPYDPLPELQYWDSYS
jgi:peptidoglycan hydrolase-like protein with peptidoglycan-binding domain